MNTDKKLLIPTNMGFAATLLGFGSVLISLALLISRQGTPRVEFIISGEGEIIQTANYT